MDREMRRQYTVLVDFLGHILGPDYEVALHELKDDSNEIIAIANGELTGRHLGSPLSNKMLEYLTSHLYETQDYVLRFESTAITGKKMCSNSLFIKGPHNELAGLLCINFDSSRYQELSARVMDLCSNMLTPGVQSGTRLIVEDDTDPTAEPPEKTYPTSIAGATASIVSEVVSSYPVPVDPGREDGDHGGPEPQGRVPTEGLRQLCGQGAAQLRGQHLPLSGKAQQPCISTQIPLRKGSPKGDLFVKKPGADESPPPGGYIRISPGSR
mgnify:CR=1 FL=1